MSFILMNRDISELCHIVNCELSLVVSWFKGNKLILHPVKTKFIIFHPSRKKINLDLSIFIDGNKITRVERTKSLGIIIIYQNLSSWQPHIKTISFKIAKSVGIIVKLQQFELLI